LTRAEEREAHHSASGHSVFGASGSALTPSGGDGRARFRMFAPAALLVAMFAIAGRMCAQGPPDPHVGGGQALQCGVTSLIDLCSLAGMPVAPKQQAQLSAKHAGRDMSLLDVVQAAHSLGLALKGLKASLDDLRHWPGPKIIHLDPLNAGDGLPPRAGHFLVLDQLDASVCRLIDRSEVLFQTPAELAERYSGHALVLDPPEEVTPALELSEFDHAIELEGLDQVVSHTFTLRNRGDVDLTVVVQRSDCGALDASLSSETIPPGEEAELAVEFKVAHSGTTVRTVRLLTTDLTRPVALVTLRATAPHELLVWPERLGFWLRKSETQTQGIRITGPPDMQVVSADSSLELLTARLREEPAGPYGSREWSVLVAAKPGLRTGVLGGHITISTTHAQRPQVRIPVRLNMGADLALTPPGVYFGFVNLRDRREQTLIIRSRSGTPFTMEQGNLDAPGVSVGEPTRVTPTEWKLTVTLNAERPGIIDTKLVVTADVPGEETLEIPIYAHVVAEE
jgi:hypothetical protein